MIRITALAVLLSAGIAFAADEEGAAIFRQNCSVGYCHGSGGTAGRAPKLLGREFDTAYVKRVVSSGVPNTGMPAWQGRLTPAQLDAVIAYVVRLSGGTAAAPSAPTAPSSEMPAAAKRGKAAFFEPLRGTRCGTCHALEGVGAAVGPNLASSNASPTVMREGKPATIRTARLRDGETFPGLLVEQKEGWARVYDLTLPLPVLRTLAAADVQWSEGSAWRHAQAVTAYTDAELADIAAYLAWVGSH